MLLCLCSFWKDVQIKKEMERRIETEGQKKIDLIEEKKR